MTSPLQTPRRVVSCAPANSGTLCRIQAPPPLRTHLQLMPLDVPCFTHKISMSNAPYAAPHFSSKLSMSSPCSKHFMVMCAWVLTQQYALRAHRPWMHNPLTVRAPSTHAGWVPDLSKCMTFLCCNIHPTPHFILRHTRPPTMEFHNELYVCMCKPAPGASSVDVSHSLADVVPALPTATAYQTYIECMGTCCLSALPHWDA